MKVLLLEKKNIQQCRIVILSHQNAVGTAESTKIKKLNQISIHDYFKMRSLVQSAEKKRVV